MNITIMFGDVGQLETMKAKLNSVSPSFCLAKWMHVSIHLQSGRTHSCYLPQTHKIPVEELSGNPSALHNTKFKKLQRKKMLAGERPEECSICWEVEDLAGDQVSDRHFRSVDSWTMPFFEKARDLPWDANINPTYVEVSFSDICNFKCSYCSPHVSSSWMAEIVKHGAYKLSEGEHQHLDYFKNNDLIGIPDENFNPYVEAFWKWWPDLVKDLMFFRITGGEPLLSRHTFRLLEWLVENPQPHLELSINSNLGVPRQFVDRFFSLLKQILDRGNIKAFMLHTSVDTYGAQAEYLRHGLDFTYFKNNVESFLREFPRANFAFMCTFNNLSVPGYRKFLEWVLELRRQFNNAERLVLLDIPHLQAPRQYSAKILPAPFHRMMEEHILFMKSRSDTSTTYANQGFRAAEIDKMRRILEWMRSPSDPAWLEGGQRDFYLFFQEHDRRRGTSFLQTFPEMAEFWESCRKKALGR